MRGISDEAIKLAAQAIFAHSTYKAQVGEETYLPDGPAWDFARVALEAAAPFIIAAERERCAKIAGTYAKAVQPSKAAFEGIAQAIRSGE